MDRQIFDDAVERFEQSSHFRLVAFGASNTERYMPCMHWLDVLEVGLRTRFGRKFQVIDSGTGGVSPGCPPLESKFADGAKKMPYWLYNLRQLQAGESLKGKAVLCFIRGMAPELDRRNQSNWLKDNFAVVNGFLTSGSSSFCFAAEGGKLNADQLIELEKNRGGFLFFRVVCH